MSETLYPLPSSLLDSLDEVLRNEARWIIKDIATRIGVPAIPLIKKIMDEKRSIYLYEKDDTTFQCHALIPDSNILVHCKNPVILHTNFCSVHQTWTPPGKFPKQKLVRLQIPYDSDSEALWLDKKSGSVYNKTMDVVGFYNSSSSTLEMFVISKQSAEPGHKVP